MLQSNLQNLISDGSKTFSRRESQFSLFYPFADYVFIFLRRGRRIIIRLPFIRYPIADSFILTSKSLQCSSSFFSLPRNSTTFSKYLDNRAVASLCGRLLSLLISPSRSLSVRSLLLSNSFCWVAILSFLNSIAASSASIPSSSSISLDRTEAYQHVIVTKIIYILHSIS